MQTTSEAVRLLLGVARLGEADLAGWFGSKILSTAGRYILPRSFPRTWRPAAGQLLLLSARRWHEEALDRRPSALHLYNEGLPFHGWAAAWLAEQKTTFPPDALFDRLQGWADVDQGFAELAGWIGAHPEGRPEPVAGHLRLGSITTNEIADPIRLGQVCRSLAASYLRGGSPLAVPYYDLMS